MKPKFTDAHKYPRGYDASHETDITKTWAAARKKLEKDKQEREQMRSNIEQLPTRKYGSR